MRVSRERPEPEVPAPEIPEVAYTIPYAWGDLYMSAAAHERYGMVPLTPHAIEGYDTSGPKQKHEIEVFVVAPGEMGMPADIEDFSLLSQTDKTPSALRLIFALGIDHSTLPKALQEDIAGLLGVEELSEEILAGITDQEGIPIKQVLSHNQPQTIVHLLTSAVHEQVQQASAIILRAEAARESLHDFKRRNTVITLGALGLMGTAIALRDWLGVATTVPIATALVYQRNNESAEYLASSIHKSGTQVGRLAESEAATVANDIHNAYCKHHFDSQFDENTQDL